MEEEKIEEKTNIIDLKKVPKELHWLKETGLVSDNGLQVSGIGMLANNTKNMAEKIDKVQKFNYFMEARQKLMQEQNEVIIALLRKIATSLERQ